MNEERTDTYRGFNRDKTDAGYMLKCDELDPMFADAGNLKEAKAEYQRYVMDVYQRKPDRVKVIPL